MKKASLSTKKESSKIVGTRLYEARTKAGLSQACAARMTNRKPAHLCMIEKGKCNINLFDFLVFVRLYKSSLEYLLPFKDIKITQKENND